MAGKSKRGFAAMPREKVQEIARKGGQSSHGGGSASTSRKGGQRSERNEE